MPRVPEVEVRHVLLPHDHLLKAYSKTQANIALSSAEAEYYSMVKAASEGLGLKAMTRTTANLSAHGYSSTPQQPSEWPQELDWASSGTWKLIAFGCKRQSEIIG